jgi:hypothetical protein
LHIIPRGLGSHYDLTDEMITTTWEYIGMRGFWFYSSWIISELGGCGNANIQRSKMEQIKIGKA